MIKRYTLEKHPKFKYGDKVKVDMENMGCGLGVLDGVIVGKGSEHVIDFWLVEFLGISFGPTYPYKVLSVPHVAIVDEEL